jgi:hypothetical protein
MRLEQSPHGLGLDALIQKVQSVVQTGLGQPNLFTNPLLDLLEIDLKNLGGEVGDEVFSDLGVVDLVVLT